MSLAAGVRLGPYEILSPIGSGGMGEVYRARDTRLGRDVAVKVLPGEFASDSERLRRFEQEARATAALNHPNILALHDIGSAIPSLRGAGGPEAISSSPPGLPRPLHGLAVTREEGEAVHYIVTELLEGESLRQRLRGGPLSPAKAVGFGIQIAQGLAAAHEKGIVHRDLKPENLFITKDGRIKILDFGLARLRPEAETNYDQSQAATANSPTREGKVLGTPGYMAPEQVRGQPVDARSDLFSFGCVLYEMLAGQKAFAGTTSTDVAAAILKENPPDLVGLVPKTPPVLAQLVHRCLEKRPEDRFSSAHDLAFALEAVSSGVITPPPIASSSTPESWLHRHLLLLAGLTAGLLLAAVLAGLILKPWREARPASSAQAPASSPPSLVALPCKVLGSPESAYLTDAVPSTLSTLLGEVPGMDARTPPTSFEVERVHGDLGKVAAAYGVQTLILSSVTAEGDHLVFDIQVADAKSRKVQWSHQYQGTRDNYTTMVREAVSGICKALLPTAASQVPEPAAGSEAELAFQQGKFYAARYNGHGDRGDFDRALSALKRAVNLDPGNARAAATASHLYSYASVYGQVTASVGTREQEAWVKRALDMDPQSSAAWVARTTLEIGKRQSDLRRIIEWSLKAVRLEPKDPDAHWTLALWGFFQAGGSGDLMLEALSETVRLEPLHPAATNIAWCLSIMGRNEEALPIVENELSIDPGNLWGLYCKTCVLAELGRTKEAGVCVEAMKATGIDVREQRLLLGVTAGGDREARNALEEMTAYFSDPALTWGCLKGYTDLVIPAVNRRFGKEAALDLLILATKRGAPLPYDMLMLRPDLKELRADLRAREMVQATKARFGLMVRILQDARAKGELPKYLEKPMDDLLAELSAKGAWP